MTRLPLSVIKIGGSLLSDPGRLRTVLSACAEGREGACILVPGGGAFADAVRVAQGTLGFSDALAHRLALDAMGRTAEVFCEIEPRLRIAREMAALPALALGNGVPVFDPQALKAGHRAIPETWDVTSDSLALWLATELRAARCLLLKSADAPNGADATSLSRLGLVDDAFPDFAARYGGRIVIRGPRAEMVLKVIAGREAA